MTEGERQRQRQGDRETERQRDLPSHGLQDGLGQVVGGHDDVPGLVGATPGEDGMEPLRGLPLLQRPVAQVDKELHVRHTHLQAGRDTCKAQTQISEKRNTFDFEIASVN